MVGHSDRRGVGGPRVGAALATLGAAALALAAVVAGRYWRRVLGQRDEPQFEIEIATGLPTVTVAGALGAAAALLLVAALLRPSGGEW